MACFHAHMYTHHMDICMHMCIPVTKLRMRILPYMHTYIHTYTHNSASNQTRLMKKEWEIWSSAWGVWVYGSESDKTQTTLQMPGSIPGRIPVPVFTKTGSQESAKCVYPEMLIKMTVKVSWKPEAGHLLVPGVGIPGYKTPRTRTPVPITSRRPDRKKLPKSRGKITRPGMSRKGITGKK